MGVRGIRKAGDEARTVKMMLSLTPREHRLLLERCGEWAPSVYVRRAAFGAMQRSRVAPGELEAEKEQP